jgi:hypothetical protein
MSGEIPPLSKQRPDVFTPIYRVLTLLLLTGIVLLLALSLFHKTSLTPECEAAIAKAQNVITSQSYIDLSDKYVQAVYKDSKVTTITQQTFLANEFEFDTLDMLAIQNSALLEITIACR